MAHATLQDVTDSLGRPIVGAEATQVLGWLDKIERIISRKLGDLDALISDGRLSAELLVDVETEAVIRKVKNPDGKVAEGIDDYNYRLNENARKGELFLTDDEWALLAPGSPSGAWTISPYGSTRRRGSWVHPDVWVPLP